MEKKNRFKHLIEKASIEPPDAPADRGESTPVEQEETNTPASSSSQEMDASPHEQEVVDPAATEPEDDVLDDVRRSLIEEESEKTQKESRWWRRRGRKEKPAASNEATVPIEIDLPQVEELASSSEPPLPQAEDAEEEIEELEDLINLLEAESGSTAPEPVADPTPERLPDPEPEIDFEELKRQAFQPRSADAEQESISDVRSIALEGGEEVLVEVETKPVDPVEERLKGFENALKPYRRYIYSAFAVLGIGVALVAALILFNVYQRSRPQPVQEVSNLPYPTAVSLPGGWTFHLGRGSVQNGEWDPGGAEWLEGTEVCRWVALPWSTQLEAVLRTLNPDDPIQLVMSNNDVLTYGVYSIRQLNAEEMQQLDSNSPCLLLILTGAGTEERWVLTALP
ncbi:MAG TPA: hypothetical protein VK900_06665 [Anaerolineales bacterium]|nr:hypothetical protein [Anaerolineales bacterium]